MKTALIENRTNELPELPQGILIPSDSRHPISLEGVITLGRDPANDIVVFDPHVSLFHCQFEKRPKGYFIKDLKSRNGVIVNETKVSEAELSDAASIRVGKLEYVFRLKNESEPAEIPLQSKNPQWQAQISRIPHIAQTQLPVFLHGESGTGKEIIAQVIHNLSPRSSFPFVAVNCSALAESVAESELFGHLKGSFTGAHTDRKGAFEAARNGTLFLDEIGDLPMSLQPKLLRALESQEIKPVGSDRMVKTNVRIISATHKNLKELVDQKIFREDLYYRINVVMFAIPPLRDRLEDFEDLLYTFSREQKVSFSVEAIDMLKQAPWPGNIRELKNTVGRAKALFPETHIRPEDLLCILDSPFSKQRKKTSSAVLFPSRHLTPKLIELEKSRIIAALIANHGNQRKAAEQLGVPKSTLHDRIHTYQINVKLLLNVQGLVKDPLHSAPSENLVHSGSNVDLQF